MYDLILLSSCHHHRRRHHCIIVVIIIIIMSNLYISQFQLRPAPAELTSFGSKVPSFSQYCLCNVDDVLQLHPMRLQRENLNLLTIKRTPP